MTYGLWLSTSGLQVNEYRQALSANNIANSQTTGFKHDLSVVHERAMESAQRPGSMRFRHGVLDNMTGGPWVRPTITSFRQGDLQRTDQPLDLALFGKGFFTVKDGDEVRYTRDGRLAVNPDGELVTVAGGGRFRVLDDAGQPIAVDPESTGSLSVTRSGAVEQGGRQIAKLGLTEFDDPSLLTKIGENVYRNHGATSRPATSEVRPGHVEQSTADPIDGLSDMVTISRAYEMNANLITLQDQTIGQAISRLGRIG
jgi:flagellar basal body rod protein FlgG